MTSDYRAWGHVWFHDTGLEVEVSKDEPKLILLTTKREHCVDLSEDEVREFIRLMKLMNIGQINEGEKEDAGK